MNIEKKIVEHTVLTPTVTKETVYQLNLTKAELFALRGLAWNNKGVIQAAAEAHKHFITTATDGPKDAISYRGVLNLIWEVTNPIYQELSR